MKFTPLAISDVLVFEPDVFEDQRGFFFESFNQSEFENVIGKKIIFVQDNHSKSIKGVVRGLHYQLPPKGQGKLIRVIRGQIYDVAVDLRKTSPTFGKWAGVILSASNKKQIWIPEGFAHGFISLSDESEVLYKATDFYSPIHEQCLIWNDPEVNVIWPNIDDNYIFSDKDKNGKALSELSLFK
jgi:dTDP-4-dehydrorhamnose 3,5-epimerase